MPTNVYFDTGTVPEQHLYEDLIIEQLRIYGQDVYYIPRKLVGEDKIFGEDALSKFEDAYLIEMYIDNIDGYEGEKELMTKFGLDIQDDATFTVSRRRWEQFVSIDNNIIESSRPNEGDLVFWPKGNKLFEITFVDKDDPFYQVHNLPTYKLKCKTFEYGSEALDTGITEIDAVETNYSLDMLSHQLTLESGTGSGSILMENPVEGSAASYIILETYNVATIDKNSQNDDFEVADDNILDFTESNPFGDAGK